MRHAAPAQALQIRRTRELKAADVRAPREIFASKSTAIVAKDSIRSGASLAGRFRAPLGFDPRKHGQASVASGLRGCGGKGACACAAAVAAALCAAAGLKRETSARAAQAERPRPIPGGAFYLSERDDPVGRVNGAVIDRAADHQDEEKQPRKGCAVFARKHGPTSGLPLADSRGRLGRGSKRNLMPHHTAGFDCRRWLVSIATSLRNSI